MTLQELEQAAIAFLGQHQAWIIPIIFLLAFGESLAFISLLLPATIILVGVGALIGGGALDFWLAWCAASLGAFAGDWVSYVVGSKLGWRVTTIWPLNSYPGLLESGYRFFQRWGVASVFLGRFLGPLRAIVPLLAGICKMSQTNFTVANIASAVLWAFAVLAPGAFGLKWLLAILR